MAIKDEYEVARLYADGAFERKLREQFEVDFKLRFHLAPPSFAPRDPQTGQLKKLTFGPWMLPAFRALAALKGLRGGRFDVFGRSDERKMERRLRDEYFATVEEIVSRPPPESHGVAVELASVPEQIRGFGHVKDRTVQRAHGPKQGDPGRLRDECFATVEEIVSRLTPESHGVAVELASVPEQIRGFGHVKDRNVERAERRKAELLGQLRNPQATRTAAE